MDKVAENSPTAALLSKEPQYVSFPGIYVMSELYSMPRQDRSQLQAASGFRNSLVESEARTIPTEPYAELGSRREAWWEAEAK